MGKNGSRCLLPVYRDARRAVFLHRGSLNYTCLSTALLLVLIFAEKVNSSLSCDKLKPIAGLADCSRTDPFAPAPVDHRLSQPEGLSDMMRNHLFAAAVAYRPNSASPRST